MTVKHRYQSLDDYLVSSELSVDGQLDDGWGAIFPVKGKEIQATVLFADITSFTARTVDLTSTETLIFVNNFLAWISAEGLRNGTGIIDKYIGDELMIVFSTNFGSDDTFVEAVQTARWMCEHDALDFVPHVGIASGEITVGYVGTPIKYNCSVFGAPVALAARCAAVKAPEGAPGLYSSRIVFPAIEWRNRDFDDVFPPREYESGEGIDPQKVQTWKMLDPREVELKNIGNHEIQEVVKVSHHLPSISAEDRARLSLQRLSEQGRYWPAHGGT